LAGAAFASQDLTEESAEQQRGAVQVGDPFMEKLVMEACLELLATGAVAGIQDMGAAGLTCSTCETAARASTGIETSFEQSPATAVRKHDPLRNHAERVAGANAHHRERKVAKPRSQRIFDKWDLPWSEIGMVTDTGRMIVRNHGQVVADIRRKKLADESTDLPPRVPRTGLPGRCSKISLGNGHDRSCFKSQDSAQLAEASPPRIGFSANTITWSGMVRRFARDQTRLSFVSRTIRSLPCL